MPLLTELYRPSLMLLTDFPDQRELLMADFDGRIGTAVEELVRYSSPVIFMRRTVTRDHRMNGQDFHEGDKTVLYYWSANQDETVFADPERLDITRSPPAHPARTLPPEASLPPVPNSHLRTIRNGSLTSTRPRRHQITAPDNSLQKSHTHVTFIRLPRRTRVYI